MSGYRLTLRALSASVRHHPGATANLRRLYRPAFRSALLTCLRHEKTYTKETEQLIMEWNERDQVARQRRAGTWDAQAAERKPSTPSKPSSTMDRDHVLLNGWSALGELAVATENELRVVVGSQEQRELDFKRLTLPRRKQHSYKQEMNRTIHLVGTSNARPRELKV
ncbi:hypothetical protein FRC17_005781 [Serendipita sp. 399]|nr:hypothetical protein FRC17_005781 [Serendipita sp. 399]